MGSGQSPIRDGLFPPDLPRPPRDAVLGFEVPACVSLDAETRFLYARYMELYAAMVDNIDQNLARLLSTIEAPGELDNTIDLAGVASPAVRNGAPAQSIDGVSFSTRTRSCILPTTRTAGSTTSRPLIAEAEHDVALCFD